MDERLTPQERIRKKKDFIDLYRKGSRYRGKYFHFVYRPGIFAFSRLAVVVGKKVGKAATRNKIKRRIRALFRRKKGSLGAPMDLILVAKIEMADLSWKDLSSEFESALEKIMRKNSFS